MKTVTEFTAFHLKKASEARAAVATEGKSPEELSAAMAEGLKLEGDALQRTLAALDSLHGKFNDLKRVLVFSLNEGEKAPHGAIQQGELWYLPEFYPPVAKAGAPVGKYDGKPGGKGGGRGGRGGRSGKPGGRNERGRGKEGKEGRGPTPNAPGKPSGGAH